MAASSDASGRRLDSKRRETAPAPTRWTSTRPAIAPRKVSERAGLPERRKVWTCSTSSRARSAASAPRPSEVLPTAVVPAEARAPGPAAAPGRSANVCSSDGGTHPASARCDSERTRSRRIAWASKARVLSSRRPVARALASAPASNRALAAAFICARAARRPSPAVAVDARCTPGRCECAARARAGLEPAGRFTVLRSTSPNRFRRGAPADPSCSFSTRPVSIGHCHEQAACRARCERVAIGKSGLRDSTPSGESVGPVFWAPSRAWQDSRMG
jgi:hypothetical protein